MCNPLCCKCCSFCFVLVAVASISLNMWMLMEHGDFGLPTVPLVEGIFGIVCGLYTVSLGACHHYIERIRQSRWQLNSLRAFASCGSALLLAVFICTVIATINLTNECVLCDEDYSEVQSSYVCEEFCVNKHDVVFLALVTFLPIQLVYSMAMFLYTCCCVCTYTKLTQTRRKLASDSESCVKPQRQSVPLLEFPAKKDVDGENLEPA